MSLPFTCIKVRILFQIMSILLISILSDSVNADSLEKLLMPGQVISGHQKYENECSQCHDPLGNRSQSSLCLDCHKKIKADQKSKEGFHSSDQVRHAECASCHTDHVGRQAKIVLLNPEQFNHDLTDFKLKNSHQNLPCNSCHLPKKKYREASHSCIGCHKDDDIHQGELGKKCQDCHKDTRWQQAKKAFDHNKTKFKLFGKHKETSCLSCHVSETYTNAPKTCYGCHQINDVHNQRFGKKCQDCHQESSWKKIDFNHDKTDFPLTGHHDKVACNDCHTSNKAPKLPTNCIGCHKQNDVHAGHNGTKCKDCHNTRSWKTTFDHNKDADFHLLGQHKDLACTTCHKGSVKEKLPVDCFDCHQQDDVHQRSQGKQCQNCHNEKDWFDNVLFDHDVTHFPLVGLHATVSCEACHSSTDFKDTDSHCISCHRDDDFHKKSLGENCQQCHTPSSWNLWQFDHDTQTDYKLTGKHAGLTCQGCHNKPATQNKLNTPTDCVDCHRKDDIHSGRFGSQCDRCHNTENFENFIFKSQ